MISLKKTIPSCRVYCKYLMLCAGALPIQSHLFGIHQSKFLPILNPTVTVDEEKTDENNSLFLFFLYFCCDSLALFSSSALDSNPERFRSVKQKFFVKLSTSQQVLVCLNTFLYSINSAICRPSDHRVERPRAEIRTRYGQSRPPRTLLFTTNN